MAHRFLRDHQADGWERSDFPIICESCLGDNPYVRMKIYIIRKTAVNQDRQVAGGVETEPNVHMEWYWPGLYWADNSDIKLGLESLRLNACIILAVKKLEWTKADYDKECKICTRPFTVFRWRPGRDARFKKTEICQTCSKLKNVCQVCLLDLEYGLPVQVRDTALSINSNDAIPKSDVNREYFAEEHDRRARAGIDYESSYGKARPNDTILKLQRTQPYYKRNRAHVCSFYVRGECTRGAECPYRHEMPITGELSQQNIKDRYYGEDLFWLTLHWSIRVLHCFVFVWALDVICGLKLGDLTMSFGPAAFFLSCWKLLILVKFPMSPLPALYVGRIVLMIGLLVAEGLLMLIFRVNDPVAMKLLNKAGEMPSLEPPEDESIKTLYVGGVDARVTEQDLRDNFYAHGEIESIKMHPQKAFAFVTYTTREGAEKAAEELSNKLVIKGLRLKLMWGKPQTQRPESEGSDEARQQAVAHSGMLPRSLISQQQNQYQQPGTQDQAAPTPYFNIPPPPQQERAYYPSMDPQRMGAVVPSGEGESKSGPEKQQQGQHYNYPPMPPPHGQYQQHLFILLMDTCVQWHHINITLHHISLQCPSQTLHQ
ncbi:hypothetical protein Pint_32606 [Pistacia integerrima]|uniref:Uncharacterized protein n=1 Tax=Pistacia integerrima TaxID=434235 RepID=A0ACC0XR50_9ROSI|nr:hypothetical protein Pint_32606 [Pistacia integerrima]